MDARRRKYSETGIGIELDVTRNKKSCEQGRKPEDTRLRMAEGKEEKREGETEQKFTTQDFQKRPKRLDNLEIVLEQCNKEFDCLILTETRNDFDLDSIQRRGYYVILNFGDTNHCDGTAVYLKSNFKFQDDIVKMGPCKAATYERGRLHVYLNECKKNCDVHLIVEDIFINILDDQMITFDYLNVMSEFDFISLINMPNRTQDMSSTCLDHIFMNVKKQLSEDSYASYVSDTFLSHHIATILNMNLPMHNETADKNEFTESITFKRLKYDLQEKSWNFLYGSDNNQEGESTICCEGDTILEDPAEVDDAFDGFFSDVGSKIAEKIEKPQSHPQAGKTYRGSIFLAPTNNAEIHQTLQGSKNNKSPGLGNITAETIKKIINLIMEKGICSVEFESVVPVYKK
ncbi:hypothetical protein WA026_021932, partial [Henosepilachna vigintioctopunctata]